MPEAIRPGSIRLIVGLGNPGKEYERTRHNAGFWLVERYAQQSGVALRKDGKYQALVGRMPNNGAWLVLPQGFMNASGHAVQMLAGFFGSRRRRSWWCTTSSISRPALRR